MAFQLHKECQEWLDYLAANPPPSWEGKSMQEIRQIHSRNNLRLSGGLEQPFEGERRLLNIPSKNSKDGIEAFAYKPWGLSPDPPIMVFFHGGGLCMGAKEAYDATCKSISELAGCVVVNSDYRLAPEFPFPACIDDGGEVVQWVLKNKQNLGGTDQSPVGIAGDSGGGTISASLAHDISELKFQVLIYPHVTPARDYSLPSFTTYKDGPLLTLNVIKWFENKYAPVGEERNPRLASILRPTFSHLPPTLMLIAQHDALYSGSHAYAQKLTEHGVSVETHEFPGAIHAFFHAAATCPTLTMEAREKVVTFIKSRKF